jgi:hypothetical protein
MRDVETVDLSGALFLIARMLLCGKDSLVLCKEPASGLVTQKLRDLGFYSYFKGRMHSKSTNGNIVQQTGAIVDVDVVEDLLNAPPGLTSKLAPEVRKKLNTLIKELMKNTKHHASLDEGRQAPWWIGASWERDKVVFMFLDYGVGIFKSRNCLGTQIRDCVRTEGGILKQIFMGELTSRTGKAYRGKGLPSIHDMAPKGYLRGILFTGKTAMSLDTLEPRTIGENIPGTCYYWSTPLSHKDSKAVHESQSKN